MFGNNFDWKRGLAGMQNGQRGAYAYDANQRAGELHKARLGQVQAQGQAAQQKQQQATRESVMGAAMQGAKYLRSLPVEQRSSVNGRAALEMFGVPPEMVGQFEAAGVFNDLSDATLDGFINSGRSEQVLKDKEVLLGADGKPIYSNRYNAPQVVADGSALVRDDGNVLYDNQKAPDLPTGMQINPETGQAEYMPAYLQGQERLKAAGRPSTTVTVGMGEKLTPGQTAVDKAYADDYLAWRQGGGSDNAKLVNQLDYAVDILDSGADITGPVKGAMPDFLRSVVSPEAQTAKDVTSEVVQRNLRLILGAQFTEREGQQLIARAYNPMLPEAENKRRVKALITQMKMAADAKESAAQYFEQNGTLRGWTGKQYTMQDFYNAVDNPESVLSGDQASSSGTQFEKGVDGIFYHR